jgi:hypothetical protein
MQEDTGNTKWPAALYKMTDACTAGYDTYDYSLLAADYHYPVHTQNTTSAENSTSAENTTSAENSTSAENTTSAENSDAANTNGAKSTLPFTVGALCVAVVFWLW